VELIKSVLLDVQLLQVRNADFYFFTRPDVPDLHVHDVLAIGVDLRVHCLFSFLDGLLVLLLGLFFFLDCSFDSFVSELSHKFVDAGFWIDGETELNFEEFISRVDIPLFKGDTRKSISDLDVIFNVF